MDPEYRASAKRVLRWVGLLLGRRSDWDEPIDELNDLEEYGAMLKEQIKEWEKELREEGIKEGIEKGIEKGIKEGIKEGEVAVLVRLLTGRFGSIPDPLRRRIDTAGSEQLLAWSERILTAEKIEDVFEE